MPCSISLMEAYQNSNMGDDRDRHKNCNEYPTQYDGALNLKMEKLSESSSIQEETASPEACSVQDQKVLKEKTNGDNLPSYELDNKKSPKTGHDERHRYFCYDHPLAEDTGVWIPVSVPPMSHAEHEEWTRGFPSHGGYVRERNMGWDQCVGEEKKLTMWDVVVELLLEVAARGKVVSFAISNPRLLNTTSASRLMLEEAWKEMAQTLTEVNTEKNREIMEREPPRWLPDSAAASCMLCGVRFHPILCSRHHCRFCGGVFCGDCTKGRSLLPPKFRTVDPQRVCDVCCVRLESLKPCLMNEVSRAAQLPTHDLTDLSTLRSWLNSPCGNSLEYEIYKATNTIRSYSKKVALRKHEKAIPGAILRQAKGLAILTAAKIGTMFTYNIGTGLVIARRKDGTWSPPSAVSSFGMGWGAQAGGELTDLIVVLRTDDAVRTFSGRGHVSMGAALSAAVGIAGRTVAADIRAGDAGHASSYTYSCSQGAFIGCSVEGSIVITRTQENSRFYGSQMISGPEILLGSLPRPPAAGGLYNALGELYEKLQL